MKRNLGYCWSGRVRKAVIIAALAVLPFGRVSIGDATESRDPCEREALRAYIQALKLCELAQDSNPRLRCYEAARSVYLNTLAECRGR
ncbi:MAG: hypothetical protein U1G07_14250 [Verrucomicrobiota bacterium]